MTEPAPTLSAEARGARLTISLSGTNLERAGDYNQRVVLQAIRLAGETTRGELVAVTGLTAPTIANISRRLVREGWVREAGRVTQGRGQPAVRLAIDPDGAFAVGVNIDRDHLSLVCLDLAGAVRCRVTHEHAFPTPEGVRAFLREELATLAATADIRADRLIGTGLAVPDAFAHIGAGDEVARAWDGVDPATLIADLVPGPVHVDNDAAAAALGELRFGAGRGLTSFFLILFCTGLGGGMVVDGSFYRGASGRSGEIGYLPTDDGRPLERRVSIAALHARLAAAGQASGTPAALSHPSAPAARVIAEWVEEAAELLVAPLVAVNCLLDPQAVLVGGRLPEPIAERLVARLNARLEARAADLPTLAPVRLAAMAPNGPAVGAALLPFLDRLLPSDAILMNVVR